MKTVAISIRRTSFGWRQAGSIRLRGGVLAKFLRTFFLVCCSLLWVNGAALSGGKAKEGAIPQVPIIEVEAEGEVKARPDQAILVFSVVNQAADPTEAGQVNARNSEQFLGAMKKLLGAEEKLKTLSYQVFPIYKQVEKVQGKEKSQTSEVAGYRVDHSFLVEIKDLTRIGKILDAGLKNGATQARGPYFEHSRQEELFQQAAVLALQRARSLAEALAQGAGMKVKSLLKISTGYAARARREATMVRKTRTGPQPSETSIEVGEERYEAQVTATFELAP